MSLRVWLPLNGSLENKGISGITLVSGTAVYKTSGKIGQYALNLNSRITFDCSKLANLKTFSICFWGMSESSSTFNTNWMDLLGFTDVSTGGANGLFRWETGYNGNNGIHWHDNATNAMVNGAHNHITSHGIWKHCCVVFDYEAGKIYSYDDGVLTQTHNHAGGHFNANGRFYLGETNAIEGKITDVRFYDHALSAAEVKEISQGLVLHYKLDGFQGGYGNPNLLPASDTTFFNTTRSFEFQGWVNNFYTTAWVNEHLTVGQQYTLSYTVTCISIPDTSIYSVSETRASPILVHQGGGWSQVTTTNDGIKSTNLLPGQSRTYKCTFTFATATESQAYYGFCGYTCLYRNADRTSTAYARFRIDNLKLELGSDVTPWVPNINDESADVIHIQDSSGYGHNGTITGNPSIISTTPRYSFGMHLERTRINSSTGFPSGNNPNFTIAFWTKIFSNITYVSYGDLCGMYDTGQGGNTFRLELCGSPPGNNLMWFRGPSGQNGGGFNMNSNSSSGWFSKDTWHHVALVGDGINKKYYCYLDGQLCQTYNGSANSWTPTGQVYLGDTIEATADFSDFRIYCTALSAADIKQLYQVCAKVDNLQGLHTFEIKETNKNLLAGKLWSNGYSQHNPLAGLFTNFNSKGEYQFIANGTSAGSEYIPINPTGHTYEYDYTISVNAGNQFYIGFERYDANKTARSNNACIYTTNIKPSTDIIKQHFTGTVNLSTDGTNPCSFIALRILNGWSGTTSGVTGTATIHSFSLREIGTKQNPKLTKQGQFIEEELKEETNMKLHKNGIVETNNLIER